VVVDGGAGDLVHLTFSGAATINGATPSGTQFAMHGTGVHVAGIVPTQTGVNTIDITMDDTVVSGDDWTLSGQPNWLATAVSTGTGVST